MSFTVVCECQRYTLHRVHCKECLVFIGIETYLDLVRPSSLSPYLLFHFALGFCLSFSFALVHVGTSVVPPSVWSVCEVHHCLWSAKWGTSFIGFSIFVVSHAPRRRLPSRCVQQRRLSVLFPRSGIPLGLSGDVRATHWQFLYPFKFRPSMTWKQKSGIENACTVVCSSMEVPCFLWRARYDARLVRVACSGASYCKCVNTNFSRYGS